MCTECWMEKGRRAGSAGLWEALQPKHGVTTEVTVSGEPSGLVTTSGESRIPHDLSLITEDP